MASAPDQTALLEEAKVKTTAPSALGYECGMPLGNDSTMPLGNDSTMPLSNDSTMPLGNDSTMPLGNDSTMSLGNGSTMQQHKEAPKWVVKVNSRALEIVNPIRQIVEQMGRPNPDKELISLAQGDPTVYGNLPVNERSVQAVIEATTSGQANGYSHSCGLESCRTAVAATHSPVNFPVEARNVFMTAGCSGALEKIVAVLAAPGANMLLPAPAFCLYETLCAFHGMETRFYPLDPSKRWEADLQALEALIDSSTAGLLICNPGNPTGQNYSREHLVALVALAERNRIPIIADEVYAGMVFEGEHFTSVAEVSCNVPVLSAGAVSKRWLAPGWRCGWIVAHDRNSILTDAGVLEGLGRMQQITLGPCGLIQQALPAILASADNVWSAGVMRKLAANAKCCVDAIGRIPGLRVEGVPQGALYVMVTIETGVFTDMRDDVEFSRRLQEEESVMVLPGQCFRAPGMFRICFAAPVPILDAAFDRLHSFCARHASGPSTPNLEHSQ